MAAEELDFRSEMRALLESGGKATLKKWDAILRGGGKKKIRRACSHCGNQVNFEVEVIDTDEQRRILDFLATNTLAKPSDDAPAGPQAGDDLRTLTDDELNLFLVQKQPDGRNLAEDVYELSKRIVKTWESGERTDPWPDRPEWL